MARQLASSCAGSTELGYKLVALLLRLGTTSYRRTVSCWKRFFGQIGRRLAVRHPFSLFIPPYPCVHSITMLMVSEGFSFESCHGRCPQASFPPQSPLVLTSIKEFHAHTRDLELRAKSVVVFRVASENLRLRNLRVVERSSTNDNVIIMSGQVSSVRYLVFLLNW